MSKSIKQEAAEILALADIKINGDRPWDIQVHNEKFYNRVLTGGSLALGESYMDGWWDVKELDQFFFKILSENIREQVKPLKLGLFYLKAKIFNRQSKSRAFEVGEQHYDTSNELFQLMLDKRMTYTCGYWKNAKNLDEAQEAKLDLVCRKLHLQPGQKVLDIGCGFGSFMKFAAEKYGVSCVGLSISKEQVKLGQEMCEGLPIEFRLEDYRDTNEKFDHIVSLGMFEHVGDKNYREYFEVARRCLKDDGLFLLHTIASDVTVHHCDPWFDKYIFPNGMLPSIKQIGVATEKLFVMEDWHNFGAYYDMTLKAWFHNFDANWDTLKENHDERFYRMYKYYLLSLSGGFRARDSQLWQIVFSKNGVPGGYESVR